MIVAAAAAALSQKNTNKTISISDVRNSFPWQSNQTSHKQKEKEEKTYIFSFCSCTHWGLGVFYSFCNDQGLLQQAEDVSHIGNLRQIATTNWTSKWNEFTSVYATFCWHSHKNSNWTYSTVSFFFLLDYRPIFANAAHTQIHTGNKNRCECSKMFICWNFSMLFLWLAIDYTVIWWLRVGISNETHFESWNILVNLLQKNGSRVETGWKKLLNREKLIFLKREIIKTFAKIIKRLNFRGKSLTFPHKCLLMIEKLIVFATICLKISFFY